MNQIRLGNLCLPTEFSELLNAPRNNFGNSVPITPNVELANERIPDFLKKFGGQETWNSLHITDILQNKVQSDESNIYVSRILLKSHDLNLVFEKVRTLIHNDTYFAFRIITAENIKINIQQRFSPVLFHIYYIIHYLFRRVLPKLKGFRKISRLLKNPVAISKSEIIGRLIYKGFGIVDFTELASETIIIARINNTANPSETQPLPDEGILFKMRRMGQHGKPIIVYKLRSMHPYAEYLQQYIHTTNGLDSDGKFKNDFRVSTGGHLLRKYWIDEIPMLFNLIKGDIKLVGVRPISEHYFSLYPAQLQLIRRKHKPGLLPPFYADLPATFDEIVASEMTYLKAYERKPLSTDLLYLKKIITNIIFSKARSK